MNHKEQYIIVYEESPSTEHVQVLREGLMFEASQKKGMGRIVPFAFFVRDQTHNIVGGVQGTTLYGCLYTNLLWLDRELRQKGLGTKLLQLAEKLGKERGCTFATVNTMDWEALGFYQKLGYTIECTREGFEQDSKMYFLRKPL